MNFWQGKRVLITGHTGFKGGWLSLWLQFLNADVIGYALLPPTTPNLFTLAGIENGMTSIIGDIRDFSALQAVINQYQPEIVFHMAAQPLVQYSYQEPAETYATNVMGTVHLLEALRKSDKVKVIVNITTDKCYENKEWHWGYRENDTLGGHDPYSNSKACSELVTSAYRNSYFLDKNVGVATVRAGNVIGGGDWAENRLVPDFIRACITNQILSIRHPQSVRPWQHVLDPLSGYLLLAQQLWSNGKDFSESWNFGPHDKDALPVEYIVNRLTQLWDNGIRWKLDDKTYLHETKYLKLDTSKARLRLNWHPKWNIEIALRHTVDWYKAYLEKSEMRDIALQQITAYEKSHYIQEIK